MRRRLCDSLQPLNKSCPMAELQCNVTEQGKHLLAWRVGTQTDEDYVCSVYNQRPKLR